MLRSITYVLLVFCSSASVVYGQPLPPTIDTVWPSVGTIGTTTEVAVRGTHLPIDTQLVGLHPEIIISPKPEGVEQTTTEQRFELQIPAEFAEQVIELRVLGANGVSNPRPFRIVRGVSRCDAKIADSSIESVVLALNETVHSDCEPARSKRFATQLEKGQAVQVDCWTRSIDSNLMPIVSVFDARGKRVYFRRARRSFDLRGSFIAPESDLYQIEVKDALNRGGAQYFFQLRVGDPSSATICDRPVQGKFESTGRAEQIYDFDGTAGEMWAIDLYSARLGAHTDPELIIGKLTAVADQNALNFERLQVVDDRDYLPGSLLGYQEKDPGMLWTVPADGKYRLQARDLQMSSDRESDRRYELEIRKPNPDFRLLTIIPNRNLNLATASPRGITMLRGDRLAVEVAMIAIDDFLISKEGIDTTEVIVTAENLPAGITAEPIRLSRRRANCHLILTADTDAIAWAGPIRLVGKATCLANDDPSKPHVAEPYCIQFADPDGRGRPLIRRCHSTWISIDETKTAPLRIQLDDPAQEHVVKLGTTLAIPVKIEREQVAAGKVTLRMVDLPANVTATELILEGETLTGNLVLTIPGNAVPGRYSAFINAETEVVWPKQDGSTETIQWFTPSNTMEFTIDA